MPGFGFQDNEEENQKKKILLHWFPGSGWLAKKRNQKKKHHRTIKIEVIHNTDQGFQIQDNGISNEKSRIANHKMIIDMGSSVLKNKECEKYEKPLVL